MVPNMDGQTHIWAPTGKDDTCKTTGKDRGRETREKGWQRLCMVTQPQEKNLGSYAGAPLLLLRWFSYRTRSCTACVGPNLGLAEEASVLQCLSVHLSAGIQGP